jgi:hypothetical protein
MRLPLNPPVDAVPGVRYHWLEGDLKAARERPDHRLGDVIECLRYARRSHGSIWSMRDPVPALRAGARVSAGTMRAIIHSRVRRRSASIRNDALPLDGRDDHPPRPATEAAEF